MATKWKKRTKPRGPWVGIPQDVVRNHICATPGCGKWGCYGTGFSARNGEIGTWHCAEHRPKAADPADHAPPDVPTKGTQERLF